mmetsp:Transcript_47229/g.101094  ORF Transcript_47229/g.101094 Transcript_47229/m.101094 type:complete len:88 (+) Transcript_47229:120-383(+)
METKRQRERRTVLTKNHHHHHQKPRRPNIPCTLKLRNDPKLVCPGTDSPSGSSINEAFFFVVVVTTAPFFVVVEVFVVTFLFASVAR